MSAWLPCSMALALLLSAGAWRAERLFGEQLSVVASPWLLQSGEPL